MSRRQSGGISGRCVMVAGVADYIDEPRSAVRQQREKTVREERKSWRYNEREILDGQYSCTASFPSGHFKFCCKKYWEKTWAFQEALQQTFSLWMCQTCSFKHVYVTWCQSSFQTVLASAACTCSAYPDGKKKKKLWTHCQCSSAQTNNFVLLIIQVCRWWRCVSVHRRQWRPLICNPRRGRGDETSDCGFSSSASADEAVVERLGKYKVCICRGEPLLCSIAALNHF